MCWNYMYSLEITFKLLWFSLSVILCKSHPKNDFSVVINGCESWTIKKAEHWKIDAFELWCWRRLLRVPWTARRSNQSILKEWIESHSVVSNSLWPNGLQHARLHCSSLSPRVCSHSCPLSQWCYPNFLSSVAHFSSCPQSVFPSIRVFSNDSALHIRWPKFWSFSFSISPFSEYSGLISLQSKGLSRVLSNTTDQKHQFFGTQPSLRSNSHTCTWLLEKP